MVTGTQTISNGRKALKDMNKPDLVEILDALEIDYNKKDTNAEMINLIQSSGKYNNVTESKGATKVVEHQGKKVKMHKALGPYRDVIVNTRDPKETQLFFSIGIYTYEFRSGEVVSLPKAMIKFIKTCSSAEHVFDPQLITENGNIGGMVTKQVPNYFVSEADDD